MEQQLFQAIEDGNTRFVHPREVYQIQPGVLSSKDSLRSTKNLIITAITLATRAAIRGGLPEKSAYALADYYIRMLEDSDNIANVYQISQDMFSDFTARVHKCKMESGYSKEVLECISYMNLNLDKPFSLKKLSGILGYNANYLCTKFKRETGSSVGDYFTDLKIERAKVLLKNSSISVHDICDMLGYGSFSYFCSLFHKKTGLTPLEYRNSK